MILHRIKPIAASLVLLAVLAGPAVACSFAFGPLLRRAGKARTVGAFCCGFFAVLLAALLTACALALSGEGFIATAKAIVVAHVPIMLVEGAVTAMAVGFLAKVRPELLAQTPTR